MIGGINCPPVDAQASTAPANLGGYPSLFMRGIVKDPVVTTLAAELPLNVPIRPLASTAAFAGPPVLWPVSERAISL